MTKSNLKGVYTLNPTKEVMKQGSKQSRMETTKPMPGRFDQTDKQIGRAHV